MKYRSDFYKLEYTGTRLEEVNKQVDRITEIFYIRYQKGFNNHSVSISEGDYEHSKELARLVSERLNALGFYSRYGEHEVTSGGLMKNFVTISLDLPKKELNWFNKLFKD